MIIAYDNKMADLPITRLCTCNYGTETHTLHYALLATYLHGNGDIKSSETVRN